MGSDKVPSCSDSIHVLVLEKVVEGVEFEAFVKQFDVDVVGETEKTDSFIFNLGDKSFAAFILICNQFSNEIFSVGLCDRFRL